MNQSKKMASSLAGKPAQPEILINVPKLISAYYVEKPDPHIQTQRVSFGTSGHRGSSLEKKFNEWHILAITQAICLYRKHNNIQGPLFLGIDTHALSIPAFMSAVEVLAANDVKTLISQNGEYTPTPVISHAILTYNKNRTAGFADGIVITPSHNPPKDGGFKYNPPTGGPAPQIITEWIEKKANEFLETNLKNVKRMAYDKALLTTVQYDYLNKYVNDLENVIDMEIIRHANIRLGVDPLGGAGVHYWKPLADKYNLNLTVVNNVIDPTFSFMTVDWDGQIRMDPSSPYAMVGLLKLKEDFDIAFACDTDHDRHGIVTKKAGLLSPNHYLSVAIDYLFKHRAGWNKSKSVGKTVVSSQMINWVTEKLGRNVYEVPVGFKWFTDGLYNGSLGFCGEESAGATFDRLDGSVWTTDKDGLVLALLSAEITAKLNCDLADIYLNLENEFGKTFYQLDDAKATVQQKNILKKISDQQITSHELAGDKITNILTVAPGNHESLQGVKVETKKGWFTIRPSGTEEIYKIYAESFVSENHLQRILEEAKIIVNHILEPSKDS